MRKHIISAIFARDDQWGIGYNNTMPWGRIFPTDLRFFRAVTTCIENQVLVVGRKTFESLPPSVAANREIAILSRSWTNADGNKENGGNITVYNSTDELIGANLEKDLMIIGGAEIYALFAPMIDVIYETIVHDRDWEVDTDLSPLIKPRGRFHTLVDTHHLPNADGTKHDLLINIWHNTAASGTMRGLRVRDLPNNVAYFLEDDRYYDIIELNGGVHNDPVLLMSGWRDASFTDYELLPDASYDVWRDNKWEIERVTSKEAAETAAMNVLDELSTQNLHATNRTLVFIYGDFSSIARWGLYKACKAYKLPMKFVK